MHVPMPKLWAATGWLPLVAGFYWLMAGGLWALPFGLLMLAGAALMWWLPGEPRSPALAALGGWLGVLAAPFWMLFGGFGSGLVALLLALAAAVAAGRFGLQTAVRPLDMPSPPETLTMAFKASLDEALFGYFVLGARIPGEARAKDLCQQAQRMEEGLLALGAFEDASALHRPVGAPETVRSQARRIYGADYEELSFASAFRANEDLPGGAVWNRLEANHAVHLRVMRQPAGGRPWLLCIHGYRMGPAWMDLSLFSPGWLVEHLGLNVAQMVLPLHGPRKIGLRTGDFYLDGDPLDLFHAQCQALSDLRQSLAWIRAQDPQARIGVFGVSLGGYNAALLACHEAALDFVIAAIPVSDLARVLWGVLPPAHQRYYAAQGLDEARYRHLLEPVSPLARPCLVPKDRRFILGALGDRVVLGDQVLGLAAHWQTEVSWYAGSHLTIRRERATRELVERAVVSAGWPLPLR